LIGLCLARSDENRHGCNNNSDHPPFLSIGQFWSRLSFATCIRLFTFAAVAFTARCAAFYRAPTSCASTAELILALHHAHPHLTLSRMQQSLCASLMFA
jgi:hypothetical protein